MSDRAIGVLAMAYGGPASLDEIPGYLADIRSGRTTPKRVVEHITDHYKAIGGRSPLLELSRRQTDALQMRLGGNFLCRAGMRHWAPWIEEVVASLAAEGVERAVGIVLAPHYSSMNTERYFQKVRDGLDLFRAPIDFAFVKDYHDAVPLIDAFVVRVADGIGRLAEAERASAHVVFTAHSLPARSLREGDPYDSLLKETASLVAERAGLSAARWSWSYQSAGQSREPWLGPDLCDHLAELHQDGVRNVVCLPVGFVADHVEVLFDIDIEAQEKARELGMRLVRPPSLNDDPLFIEALAGAVTKAARERGWLTAAERS